MTLQSDIRLCSHHPMVIDKLPEDLLMEILCRLPVRSLLRSKSVCKNWYSLIQNPSFISLHHIRATSTAIADTTDCLLVKRSLDGENGGSILSFVSNETPIEDIDIASIGLESLDTERLRLLGPCNGVVCLTELGAKSTIALCNPSMREFRVLPEPSYKKGYITNLGFGFDPFTNGYKVVKFGHQDPDFTTFDLDERVDIYDTSSDSWREVNAVSPVKFGIYCSHDSCTSWNGDFYWYAICPGGDGAVIVFRMIEEVFDEIPVPEVCLLDNSSRRKLFILNDSLALVLYPSGWIPPLMPPRFYFDLQKCFDIWVMDERGGEVSWTKTFTIRPPPEANLAFPLGFRQNGEFLLESGGGQIMSYHLDTRQMKEYQVYGRSPPECLQVLQYTESLVSVKRHDGPDGHDDIHI